MAQTFQSPVRTKPFPNLKKSNQQEQDGVYLKGGIGVGQTGKMKGVRFLLDSGDSGGITLPSTLLRDNDISPRDFGEQQIELADGSHRNVPIALLDISLTMTDGQLIVLNGVQAAIMPEGTPTLGFELIQLFDLHLEGGRLTVIVPNRQRFTELVPWSVANSEKRVVGYSGAIKPKSPNSPKNMRPNKDGVFEPLKPLEPMKPLRPPLPPKM